MQLNGFCKRLLYQIDTQRILRKGGHFGRRRDSMTLEIIVRLLCVRKITITWNHKEQCAHGANAGEKLVEANWADRMACTHSHSKQQGGLIVSNGDD